MKLYELARNTEFRVVDDKAHVPPDAEEGPVNMVYKLSTLDGMYSRSIGLDGNVYYLAAYTEVELA